MLPTDLFFVEEVITSSAPVNFIKGKSMTVVVFEEN